MNPWENGASRSVLFEHGYLVLSRIPESLPDSIGQVGNGGLSLAQGFRIKFTDAAGVMPASIANDPTAFGWIVGRLEDGSPTILALKLPLSEIDHGPARS